MPSDSCKAELNSAPSIRSTVAYQYCLLCIPFPRVQNRRTAQGLGRGKRESVRGTAATVKRATKTCNLFCIAAKELKSDVAHVTIQESNLSRNISGRVNTDFWLDTIRRDSRRTRGLRHLLQNKFALGR